MSKKFALVLGFLALTIFALGLVAGDHHGKDHGHDHSHGHDHGKKADAKPAQPEMTPEMAAAMEKMKQAGEPGPQHKTIAMMAGSWDAKMQSHEPGAEGMFTEGTSENKMIFGGRYLKQYYKSTFMGEEFTGIGFLGYDNTKKEYFGTWMDSMSTGFFLAHGTASEDGRTITTVGEMSDPMSGQTMKSKGVTTIVSHDKHVFDYYVQMPDGTWVKNMTITYTRKK